MRPRDYRGFGCGRIEGRPIDIDERRWSVLFVPHRRSLVVPCCESVVCDGDVAFCLCIMVGRKWCSFSDVLATDGFFGRFLVWQFLSKIQSPCIFHALTKIFGTRLFLLTLTVILFFRPVVGFTDISSLACGQFYLWTTGLSDCGQMCWEKNYIRSSSSRRG